MVCVKFDESLVFEREEYREAPVYADQCYDNHSEAGEGYGHEGAQTLYHANLDLAHLQCVLDHKQRLG